MEVHEADGVALHVVGVGDEQPEHHEHGQADQRQSAEHVVPRRAHQIMTPTRAHVSSNSGPKASQPIVM